MTARKVPELVDFSQERIRLLHWSWIAFFITFTTEHTNWKLSTV
jgi:hypothetical protein